MKALEFETRMSPNATLSIPSDVAAQIQPEQQIRVLLLVPEADDASEWSRLTVAQFLKGYDEMDAIYDDLSTR
jgi:hypothetical protein